METFPTHLSVSDSIAIMDSELPGYSEAPSSLAVGSGSNTAQEGSQHTLSLQDGKGFKWLTLITSSRASASTSLPIFYEGDVVSGQVDLDVFKSESIKGISVKVTAGTTLVGQEEQLFLNSETDLWTSSMPLPDGSKVAKFAKGKYSWPFSLTLPTEVEVQDQKTKRKFPLPTSFSERASTGYVDYRLIITVKRGMLRVDKTLMTTFAYVPVTRPELPSRMLQKAYKENLPLVGPEGTVFAVTGFIDLNLNTGDPDGWHTLPPLNIQGTLFDSHTAEVTLSLTYGRGTAIPLWLTLTGNDEQALDLLSIPKVVRILLVRSLATGSDATNDTDHRTDNSFFENVARAVFWAPEDYRGPGQRVLQGEVDIKGSLKPSTLFPRFTISYHLDLQPFEAAGFVATAPKSTPLLRQKVTIANFPALGVPVRSNAPPEYIQEQGADYNSSVGLLENGNQRFFHHGGTGGI
ncbi:hypothetical protein J3R83DRAFT_11847 [Lanmaoa asiatica]|nr:hypothetical protein J3R83DRAFT_11847 [Lanmaoa asiatica]